MICNDGYKWLSASMIILMNSLTIHLEKKVCLSSHYITVVNPLLHIAPTGICCDSAIHQIAPNSCPITPLLTQEELDTGSITTTPEKN